MPATSQVKPQLPERHQPEESSYGAAIHSRVRRQRPTLQRSDPETGGQPRRRHLRRSRRRPLGLRLAAPRTRWRRRPSSGSVTSPERRRHHAWSKSALIGLDGRIHLAALQTPPRCGGLGLTDPGQDHRPCANTSARSATGSPAKSEPTSPVERFTTRLASDGSPRRKQSSDSRSSSRPKPFCA